jgi:hypothetical protein
VAKKEKKQVLKLKHGDLTNVEFKVALSEWNAGQRRLLTKEALIAIAEHYESLYSIVIADVEEKEESH